MTDSDLRKTNFYKLLNWLQIRSNKMLKSKQPSLYQGIPIRATFDASTSKTKLASVSAAVAIYNFCDFFSPNWILIGIDNECSAIPHSGKHAFPRQKTQKTAFREEKCALQKKSLVAVVTSQFINLIEFLRDLLHLSNPRRFPLPIWNGSNIIVSRGKDIREWWLIASACPRLCHKSIHNIDVFLHNRGSAQK